MTNPASGGTDQGAFPRNVAAYATGVWAGLTVWAALAPRPATDRPTRWRLALVLGLLFPLTALLLRPLFGLFSAGTLPALVWCVLGSAAVGAYARAGRR